MAGTTDFQLPVNPEDLPDDPNAIAAMIGGESTDDASKTDDTATHVADGASSSAEPDKANEAGGQPTEQKPDGKPDDAEPEGVLARDGKHVLPYEVLKSTREREQEARRAAQEAQERARELERQLEALQAGKPVTELPKGGDSEGVLKNLDDAIEAIKDEVPQLATVLEGFKSVVVDLQARVDEQNKVLRTVDAERQQQAREREKSVQEQIQDAIDSIPELRYLDAVKDKDGAAASRWNSIAALDAHYRQMDPQTGKPLFPDYMALSFEQRFQKCVKADIAMNGAITVPVEYQPREAIERAAQEAVKKAGQFTPNTLSDLPGGDVPASAELNLETMDAAQLGQLAMDNPETFDRLIARYA